MQKKYINSVVGSYIVDRVRQPESADMFSDHITNMLALIKEEYPAMYADINSRDYVFQQEFLYRYLDDSFVIEGQYVNESAFIDNAIRGFGKTLGYVDNFFEKAGRLISVGAPASVIFGSLYYFGVAITSVPYIGTFLYLALVMIGLVFLILVTSRVADMTKVGGTIRISVLKSFYNAVTDQNSAIARLIYIFDEDTVKRFNARSALIFTDRTSCLTKCGMSAPKDMETTILHAFEYFRNKNKDNPETSDKRLLHSSKAEQQVECLISCNLNFVSTAIAELYVLHAKCVESNTGLEYSTRGSCDSLKLQINELAGVYINILDYLFEDSPSAKDKWNKVLETKINNVSNNVHTLPVSSKMLTGG